MPATTTNITPGRYSAKSVETLPIDFNLSNSTTNIVVDNVKITNTSAQAIPISDAGGLISIDDGNGSITVDGPLTNTELRAAAVPVSGPLTDTQLRATAVPVTGALTDTQLRATAVPVSGPLTDTQLRATPVPAVTTVALRTPTTTSIVSATSSSLILAANTARKGFCVSNVSTSKLYLSFSSPASVTSSFIEVYPGAFVLFDQQLLVSNAIYGIWNNANGTAQVTEFV